MKISNLSETTSSGCVAAVSQPFSAVQKREDAPKLKGSNLLKGIKTSAKYANSLHEATHSELANAKRQYDELLKKPNKTPADLTRMRTLRDKIIKWKFDLGLNEGFTAGQKVEVHHGGNWVPATITSVDEPGKYKIKLTLNGKVVNYVSGDKNTRALNEFYDASGKYSGSGEGDDGARQRNAKKLIAYCEKQGMRPGSVNVGYSSETGVYKVTGLAVNHDTRYDWRYKIDPASKKFITVDATQTDSEYAPDNFIPVTFDDELKEGVADTIKRGVKQVKRELDGWGNQGYKTIRDKEKPQDIVNRNKGYSDDSVKALAATTGPGRPQPPEHSPQGLQKRVLDREMKKRGMTETFGGEPTLYDDALEYFRQCPIEQLRMRPTKMVAGYMRNRKVSGLSSANLGLVFDALHAAAQEMNEPVDEGAIVDRKLKKRGMTEDTADQRKVTHLWAMITDYENRAKATKNDLKKQHYMQMASQLREKLPTSDLAEGAKVDRMVGHIKKAEKKLGKSNKEAENIAWATANKRGMLDNKNKKVDETIVKTGSQYELKSHTGKNLGKYPTKAGAEKREKQVNYFKNVKEEVTNEEDLIRTPGKGRQFKPGLLHKPETTVNPTDVVKVDVPLLIRIMEYAREDANSDLDLHDFAEQLIAASARGRTLTMKDYERIIPSGPEGQ